MKAAATWEHVSTLRTDPDNPVIHTDEEVTELRALIAETVWTEPIVCRVSDRQIIAGHRRLAAALLALQGDAAWQLSDAPKPGLVPVRFVDVDEKTARRLNLASNALAKQSAWDDVALLQQLEGLGEAAYGIGLDSLLDEEDEAAEPPTIRVWDGSALSSGERLVIRLDVPHEEAGHVRQLLEQTYPSAGLRVFLQFEGAEP